MQAHVLLVKWVVTAHQSCNLAMSTSILEFYKGYQVATCACILHIVPMQRVTLSRCATQHHQSTTTRAGSVSGRQDWCPSPGWGRAWRPCQVSPRCTETPVLITAPLHARALCLAGKAGVQVKARAGPGSLTRSCGALGTVSNGPLRSRLQPRLHDQTSMLQPSTQCKVCT